MTLISISSLSRYSRPCYFDGMLSTFVICFPLLNSSLEYTSNTELSSRGSRSFEI